MNRRTTLVSIFLLLLVLVMAGAEECPNPYTYFSIAQPSQPARPSCHYFDLKTPFGNSFRFSVENNEDCPSSGTVTVYWTVPPGATNIEISPLAYSRGIELEGGRIAYAFDLPVDPYTHKTPEVTVSYDPPPGVTKVTDTFSYGSELNGMRDESVTRPVSGGGGQAAALPLAWAQPAQPTAAQADSYYRWGVWVHFTPTGAQTMTASLCQDQMALLQGGHAFLALRFPVYPPTLAYTEPYTLPVVFSSAHTPTLSLKRHNPAATVLEVPLAYKPWYHTFLENELPAAPGERWLALGAVTTPTVDCAGVPTLTDWSYEANFWLDFGGAPEAGRGRVLPCYYCYEGQTPPTALWGALGADATSYQGWGITCLGPHVLRLAELSPLELDGMHTVWVTPTQTISLHHSVWNWSMTTPITVSLTSSSTLGLPWGVYSGTADAPDVPLVPITGPFRLELFMPNQVRHFWLIATVPACAPSGSIETLVITATDVASPTRSAWTTDLLWVGDWVAPPPPPWYRLYLPLVLRGA